MSTEESAEVLDSRIVVVRGRRRHGQRVDPTSHILPARSHDDGNEGKKDQRLGRPYQEEAVAGHGVGD
jgi:hypothetical protein